MRYNRQIQWDAPDTATVTVLFQTASDPAFTQNNTVDTKSCPAANLNCWGGSQPRTVWASPPGRVWYWRVGLTTNAGVVYSQTYAFKAVSPPDRDHDGVADGEDNCPDTVNADQRDSNHDRDGEWRQGERPPRWRPQRPYGSQVAGDDGSKVSGSEVRLRPR